MFFRARRALSVRLLIFIFLYDRSKPRCIFPPFPRVTLCQVLLRVHYIQVVGHSVGVCDLSTFSYDDERDRQPLWGWSVVSVIIDPIKYLPGRLGCLPQCRVRLKIVSPTMAAETPAACTHRYVSNLEPKTATSTARNICERVSVLCIPSRTKQPTHRPIGLEQHREALLKAAATRVMVVLDSANDKDHWLAVKNQVINDASLVHRLYVKVFTCGLCA